MMVESLHTVGLVVLDEDVYTYIIDGLDGTYRHFISTTQLVPITSFKQLYLVLLLEEDLYKRSTDSSDELATFYTARDDFNKDKSNKGHVPRDVARFLDAMTSKPMLVVMKTTIIKATLWTSLHLPVQQLP